MSFPKGNPFGKSDPMQDEGKRAPKGGKKAPPKMFGKGGKK